MVAIRRAVDGVIPSAMQPPKITALPLSFQSQLSGRESMLSLQFGTNTRRPAMRILTNQQLGMLLASPWRARSTRVERIKIAPIDAPVIKKVVPFANTTNDKVPTVGYCPRVVGQISTPRRWKLYYAADCDHIASDERNASTCLN
jgi:hypothetical protein